MKSVLNALLVFALMSPCALAKQTQADWQLVGQTRFNVLFLSIYDIKLYTHDGRYAPDSKPVKLEIQYLRKITAADLLEATEKEWRKMAIDEKRIARWSAELHAIWPDVNKQDILAFELTEESQGNFYFNQKWIGAVADRALAQAFLDIWLSPNNDYPKLRKQLIGLH